TQFKIEHHNPLGIEHVVKVISGESRETDKAVDPSTSHIVVFTSSKVQPDEAPFAPSGVAYSASGRHREQQCPSTGIPYGGIPKRERRWVHCLPPDVRSIEFLYHRDLPTRAHTVAAATA